MRKLLLTLPPVLALIGLAPVSANEGMGDSDAIALIHQMEEAARPSAEIVSALVADGRSVEDATALVVGVARTVTVQVYATLFGMCLAPDREELPEDVGKAAEVAAGPYDDNVGVTVSAFTPDDCGRFFLYLRPAGSVGVVPKGPGPDPIPPVSPSM